MRTPLLLLPWSGCTWIPIGQHFADQGEIRSPEVPETPVDPAACAYPEAELELESPQGELLAPIWLGFRWDLYEDEAGLHDLRWADETVPASFVVEVFGPEADLLCSVHYDLEGLERAPASALPDDGTIVAAWELARSAPAHTDCPELDPELFGTQDLTELLGKDWAFGLGELGRADAAVEERMTGLCVPREEWERWTLGAYVTYEGEAPSVMGYDFSYKAECGEGILQDELPDPQRQNLEQPLRPAIHEGTVLYLRSFTEYTGLSCEQSDVVLGGDWDPGGEIMEDVALVSVSLDMVPSPDGGFADFWWDSDADGILDPQASTLTVGLYDSTGAPVCSLLFDAEEAEEIDPGQLTSTSGALWRAWTLELEDATSLDCTQLDPLVFDTNDPLDIFATWSFGFAVGELDLRAPDLMEAEPVAEEVGAGFGYDLDGCFTRPSDADTLPFSITRGGLSAHWLTTPFYGLAMAEQ
jgi:hypothetical protein